MEIFKPDLNTIEANAPASYQKRSWVAVTCRNIFSDLKRSPNLYREYGPYWWLVKQALINNVADFKATTVDAEWFERMDYGDEKTNLLAATGYFESKIEQYVTYSSNHTLYRLLPDMDREDEEAWEEYEYTLVDEEMETLAFITGD